MKRRLPRATEQSLEQGRYDIAQDDALEARQAAMKAREVAVAIAHARAAVQEARGGAWELATETKRRLQ